MAQMQCFQHPIDLVFETTVSKHDCRKVLVICADGSNNGRARSGPWHADNLEIGRPIGERGQKAFNENTVLAIEGFARKRRILILSIEDEQAINTHRHTHIRNTPKRAPSSPGALSVAAKAKPNTSRVCAGSMMPSSHRRAVA